jgi:hypothetical protein
LQKIGAENPSVVELGQLFEWTRSQIDHLRGLKDEFTRDGLVQLMSDPTNYIATFDVNEPPPRPAFNLRDFMNEIVSTFFQAYFKETLKLDFCRIPSAQIASDDRSAVVDAK